MTTTTTLLADYTAPAFWIDSVDLTIDLDPTKTRVLNKMRVRRNPDMPTQALKLDGKELNLARVLVAGQGTSFKMETMPNGDEKLVLEKLPEGFEPFDLEIFTTCNPTKNTSMSGLYVSNDSFFTQCEAEGFRRITYFLDRPDVMANYSVTLRADKAAYPVLLSNGNLVAQGLLDGVGNEGRHFAKWVDPHKKPCYLFALVAGLLVCHEQKVKAKSGSEHLLQVYVRPGDLDKTEHAMRSLMASIAWDESRFGLSLDLERFMIVAVGDFNMGAMENKGLNIFNTKYVLATQNTATDGDFAGIESVVAHEYFHNWTGNRITCRDWFQLSLKEGLTVFRDQEFSMDMSGSDTAAAVQRIEDVRNLRTVQFGEDAGPMSHAVRPAEYAEINNFYTPTVYEKGAEVVRMMQTLTARSDSDPLGKNGFKAGMALYFQRHDGQAVTCDDFAQAIADANPASPLAPHLAQFKNWYSQAGTPRVNVHAAYDEAAQSYVLTLTQHLRAGQEPFVIPFALGLLEADGTALTGTHLHVMTQMVETVRVDGVTAKPVPSLLRGFSAPIIVDYDYTDAELLTLMAHDTDAFNRWEASQRLMLRQIIACVQDGSRTPALETTTVAALQSTLAQATLDAAFRASVLTLPSEGAIAEQLVEVDPQRIHAVREAVRLQLATELQNEWQAAFDANQTSGTYSPDAVSSGKRSLANMALAYLCLAAQASGDAHRLQATAGKAYQRFKDASNMTDRMGALVALVSSKHELATPALTHFHAMFAQDDLVIDKWFALQAGNTDTGGDILPLVKTLTKHPDFKASNPNRFRSLVFSYCAGNPAAFHRTDAAGYVFWSEQVLALDSTNPQVAARLARALERWKRLAEPYKSAAKVAIERVAAKANLSRDVREVVTRALA
ncbi:MAG: aminopeptidase N [Cytophagales bacterium]|nr:aminopeptidase N [Cytophagales bacterium]